MTITVDTNRISTAEAYSFVRQAQEAGPDDSLDILCRIACKVVTAWPWGPVNESTFYGLADAQAVIEAIEGAIAYRRN